MKAPFRRAEFFGEVNELKQELGCIAAITASKERIGLLAQQVSLSVLFGVSSFVATLIYDLPAFENITGVDDDDMYSPIVDQLQVESVTGDSTVAILQGMAASQQEHQQQMLRLMTALLNATVGGN